MGILPQGVSLYLYSALAGVSVLGARLLQLWSTFHFMHFFDDFAFHQGTVFFNINAFFTFNCSYFVALLCQHIYTTVATWVLVNWAHSKGPRVKA